MSDGVRARSRTSTSDGLAEIEFEDAEVARVGRDHVLEDGIAAALAKEGLIANQDIGGAQFARDEFGEEAVGLAEGAHSSAQYIRKSVRLQYIGHQGAREIPRQAIHRRRVLFEKARQISRNFVLIMEKVCRILEHHLAFAVRQGHLHADRNERANRAAGLGVVRQGAAVAERTVPFSTASAS